MNRASPLLAVLAGFAVGAVLIASCSGPRPPVEHPNASGLRQEIAVLWSQIREWRKEGNMAGLEPSAASKLSMHYKTSYQAAKICPDDPQPKTPTCQDICSLSNAICENANRICRIADELGDDSWARDKCNSAKASCREAKKRCCNCK